MLTMTLIALILAIPLSSLSSYDKETENKKSLMSREQEDILFVPNQEIGDVPVVTISATLYTRIVAVGLLFAALLSYNAFPNFSPIIETATFYNSSVSSPTISSSLPTIDAGLGLYSGLIHANTITQSMEVFLLISGALILLPWSGTMNTNYSSSFPVISPEIEKETQNKKVEIGYSTKMAGESMIPEYPLIILFTTIGGTFLLASADLVSIYLAIELQSFGVYILAALYRDSESATAAGLKYFLLGALSSALILLGSALVYGYTGLTNLDSIYELISVPVISGTLYSGYGIETSSLSYSGPIILGFILISVGLLFKVASAPFHYWAPDVYDGTPTIVTTWLTVIPKIAIFIFLLGLYPRINISTLSLPIEFSVEMETVTGGVIYLLIMCTFLSLVIGTVVGLGQYRIKRLLAYSTISHVGFLLFALSVSSASVIAGEESTIAFLFYIVQYTLTNINAFFVLLAFGYIINCESKNMTSGKSYGERGGVDNTSQFIPIKGTDIQFTSELVGQFRENPVLGLSFAICLFSIAGVPPLVGFFAKYTILYSAIHNGYVFLSIIAILASVVSAVYYLRIIRVIHFDTKNFTSISGKSLSYGGREQEGQEEVIGIRAPSGGGEEKGEITPVTSIHSYVIASTTLFILLFAVNPTLILNSTSIMAISLYVT